MTVKLEEINNSNGVEPTGNIETLDSLENAMELPDRDMVKTVKVDQGSLVTSEGDDLGQTIAVELLSYSPMWIISTNESDKESRTKARYTHDLDRVVLDWENPEETVTAHEYLQMLKDEGYEQAKIKEYIQLLAIDEEDDIVVINCSPTSRKNFLLFKSLTNKKIKDGKLTLEQATRIKVTAKKKKLGNFNFTTMTFALQERV